MSVYAYDNKTFIVESFNDTDTEVKIGTLKLFKTIPDLSAHQSYTVEIRKARFSYIEQK